MERCVFAVARDQHLGQIRGMVDLGVHRFHLRKLSWASGE
jgi:hypothetical protein